VDKFKNPGEKHYFNILRHVEALSPVREINQVPQTNQQNGNTKSCRLPLYAVKVVASEHVNELKYEYNRSIL